MNVLLTHATMGSAGMALPALPVHVNLDIRVIAVRTR